MQLSKYIKEFKKFGTTMISPNDSFISTKDFKIIEKIYIALKENVKIGDAGEKNSVHVARLMTDVKKPKIVNQKYSKKVLDILNKNYLSEFKVFLIKKNYLSEEPK